MSARLERWAAYVNGGMSDEAAAKEAGYRDTYSRQASVRIRPQAEALGLLRTAEAAATARDTMQDVLGDPEAIRAVLGALLDKAKGGDVGAIREVLDRVIGKPTQGITLDGDMVFRWQFGEYDNH